MNKYILNEKSMIKKENKNIIWKIVKKNQWQQQQQLQQEHV